MIKKSLLLALTLSFSQLSNSAVISEDVYGDFHGGQLFNLVDGDNLFIGSQAWQLDPVDGFRFVVPDDSQAIISFDFSFSNLGVDEDLAWVWELTILSEVRAIDDSGSILYSDLGSLLATEIFTTTPGFPINPQWDTLPIDGFLLNAGAYALFDDNGFSTGRSGIFSYSINIDTTPIPVPTAVYLFGSALLGLIGLKRKH